MRIEHVRRFGPTLATVAVLIGAAAESWTRPGSGDAEPYHATVREAADALPRDFGQWSTRDVPVPESAVELLRPNVLVSRQHTHELGVAASVLFVQCKDATDLLGHYPPSCYPSQGWVLVGRTAVDYEVAGRVLPGVAYTFERPLPGGGQGGEGGGVERIEVADWMLLPDGRYVRSMDELRRSAGDYTRFLFGAAHLQVLMHADWPQGLKDAVVAELVETYLPVLDTVAAGLEPESASASTPAPQPTPDA